MFRLAVWFSVVGLIKSLYVQLFLSSHFCVQAAFMALCHGNRQVSVQVTVFLTFLCSGWLLAVSHETLQFLHQSLYVQLFLNSHFYVQAGLMALCLRACQVSCTVSEFSILCSGWLYGSLNGVAGMFPAEYVRPLARHEVETTPQQGRFQVR